MTYRIKRSFRRANEESTCVNLVGRLDSGSREGDDDPKQLPGWTPPREPDACGNHLTWDLRNHITTAFVQRWACSICCSAYIVHIVVNVWYWLPTTLISSFIPDTYALAIHPLLELRAIRQRQLSLTEVVLVEILREVSKTCPCPCWSGQRVFMLT